MTAPFVGRVRELELLAEDVETVSAGHGRLTLIVGEPGIGKTSLADRAAQIASARGFEAHWGRCWQGGGAPVFWPWIQILRSLLQHPLSETQSSAVAWSAAHVDALAHGKEIPGDSDDSGAGGARGVEHARFRLFDAVASFVRAHARSRSLVIVLDDLHDADEASLLLLHFLARDLRRSPILVVATCREAEIRRSPALTSVFAAFARESRTHYLRGLDRSETEEFLRKAGDGPLDASLHDDVWRITEGNPFFVDEVLKAVLARPPVAGSARLEIPFTVKEFLRERLVPLGDDTRRLLEAAAALGRDFDLRMLARTAQQSPDECRVLLEDAAREGLVEPDDAEGRAWRFVHVLIRETLCDEIAPASVRALHLRIATLLADDRRAGLPVRRSTVAHHLLAAGPLADRSLTLAALLDSARESMARLAFEEAARDFARAIERIEHDAAQDVSGAAPRSTLPVDILAEVLIEYGHALRWGGQLGKARETFRRTASMLRAHSAGDDDATVHELFGRAVLGFGKVSETGTVDKELVSLLEEALSMLAATRSALHASLLARLAMALYFVPESNECVVLAQRAVTIAEHVGDVRAHIDALVAQHFVLWRPGTAAERLRVAESLLRLCDGVDEKEAALEARLARITGLMELGQVTTAAMEVETYDADAAAARLPVHRWHAAMLRSTFSFLNGRDAEAERAADAALEIGLAAELPNAKAFHLAQILQIRTGQRRLPLIEPDLRRAADAQPRMPIWTVCAAEAALAAGHDADARRDYERFAAERFTAVPRDGMWLATIAVLSRLAARLGDADGAAALLELLAPFHDAWVVSVSAISVPGPVRFFVGILCAAAGDQGAAIAHLEAAAELGRIHRCRSIVEQCEAELTRLAATWREASPAADGEAVFHRGTDFWTVAAGGQALRMRDSKGLRYLHYLIENPEKDFHVFDLVAAVEGTLPSASGASDENLAAGHEGDTGPAVDAAGLAAYKLRLREIRAELAQSEAFHDSGRVDLLTSEQDFVLREIAAAVGLGGRRRGTGSPAEQVRVRVTKVIGLAMKRISEANPALGRRLSREIRTGTFCAYRPDPDRPIRWITRIEP